MQNGFVADYAVLYELEFSFTFPESKLTANAEAVLAGVLELR
jgi:hypothetical protein